MFLKKHQGLPNQPLHILVAANVIVIVLATWWAGTQFLGIDNLQSMAGQLPELGLLAMGVALAMISGNGGIDLSGVALANLSGVVAALIAPQLFDVGKSQASFAATFVFLALTTGALGGMFNGVLIAKARLTPVLATLGTQLLFTGIAVVLTDGSAVRLGYAEPLAALGNETLFWVPLAFILFLIIAVCLGWMLQRTSYGVSLYLVGTNQKAAYYTGIPHVRTLVIAYGMCGALAATAGVLIASRTSSVKWDYGSSYLRKHSSIPVRRGEQSRRWPGQRLILDRSSINPVLACARRLG